jgi:hypothetical protein
MTQKNEKQKQSDTQNSQSPRGPIPKLPLPINDPGSDLFRSENPPKKKG